MKALLVVVFLFCNIIFISCEKPIPMEGTDLDFLVGDYEWVYSTNDNEYDVTTNQEISNNYGLRIDAKGFFYTFENTKQIKRYRITERREGLGDNWDYLIYWYRGNGNGIHYSGDTIMLFTYPFSFYKNYFIKVR